MYEPEYKPPYLALVAITIIMLCRSYVTYKDCRLRSLYGEDYRNVVKFVDEIRTNNY